MYQLFFRNMKTLKIISFFLFTVAGMTSSQNTSTKCPFQFYFVFGDGITDNGNSVRVLPFGPFLPSTRYPYGITFPGHSTGRWSDGLVAVDYAGLGFPNTKPYLSLNPFASNDAVAFSVEGSTVLDNSFFYSNRISIPLYNIPLSTQVRWFKRFLRSNCIKNKTDCVKRKASNSLIVFAFPEANDVGYALLQGRSIQEIETYVALIVNAQINAAREVIDLGATRIVYITAAPLGCYPYILTALPNNDPTAYDELGCLKGVNNLTLSYNTDLQTAFAALSVEFPNVQILGADYYAATRIVINQTSIQGPDGNQALKSCCGIGGRYNYDKKRFCGSRNVPVCPNPNNYVYWDGLHFTQEAYRRTLNFLVPPALAPLNCTSV